MDFQQAIMRLNEYWASKGCLLWLPHNVQVGAGTMNPATVLRVLGPEPWNVAYVEPSVRPADGRYGENPNRWQQYYQYQVILKPDPGNPQELYLDSLKALGIDPSVHDIRFVEDNWESPALGAWGLGWEVWLDGQEITQFTYFQQAGGLDLDPVSVEITYGLERIVMVLQNVHGFPEIRWQDDITYGELLLKGEVEHCTYNFEVAGVDNLRQMYDLCEAEAQNALRRGLVMPAHDYVLKCSHIFNVLDARGAVGVTERARYFLRMRDLARQIAQVYATQRQEMGYPFLKRFHIPREDHPSLPEPSQPTGDGPFTFVLEIGTEELPVTDLDSALKQLRDNLKEELSKARLSFEQLTICGTPRRLVALVRGLPARQPDQQHVVRGPSVSIAYDAEGKPTRAAQGFAKSRGLRVEDLGRQNIGGKEYVVASLVEKGRPTSAVLAELLPELLASIRFPHSMRWNSTGVSFSRPIRWYVALLEDVVIPFEYANIRSDRISRGIRSQGSPTISIPNARQYVRLLEEAGIMLDIAQREAHIKEQAEQLAQEVGGHALLEPDLIREVANLVEYPLAILGTFEKTFLRLPEPVLLAVMRKHQRYIPVVKDGKLLPYFVTIANGKNLDPVAVRAGNEDVIRARYADASYFYDADTQKPLEAFTPRLATLTFQEQLGSMLDKVERLKRLVPELSEMLGLDPQTTDIAQRAATLCKSDLATQMVVELTSLQGIMGRHYALLSGESEAVARAIEEHYLPRFVGDKLPEEMPGLVVGLADRLDTLIGLFAVGIRPTGAADPWGLRRTVLGLLQLLIEKQISLPLPEAMSLAAEPLPVEVTEGTLGEALDFVTRRLETLLRERGLRHDVVSAVLEERNYDPYLAYQTALELASWVEKPDWEDFLDNYARCVRITRDQKAIGAVDESALVEPASKALHQAYQRVYPKVVAAQDIETLLGALKELKPFIERFFDDVLVMDPDQDLRRNRLALLQAISALPEGIADLSRMEGF